MASAKDAVNSVSSFISENNYAVFLLLALISFSLWQHSTGFSWDFAAYSLNAQYWNGGNYFEWLRPPLMPLLLALLSFPGPITAEYLYIIVVSVLHFYSSLRFADTMKLDRLHYYAFSLTFFTFAWGFFAGTELLSLSLLQMSVVFLNERKSGLLLGLSVLARYANLSYIFLILFQKRLKTMAASALMLSVAIAPWLAYNYIIAGDPFASMLDNFLMNVQLRQSLFQGIDAMHILTAANFLLPFFIAGLVKKAKRPDKNDYAMLFVIIATLFVYIMTPLKEARYLFVLAMPLAYFATISVKSIKHRDWFVAIFVLLNILALATLIPAVKLEDPSLYKSLASAGDGCATMSNAWVPLTYYGRPSEPILYSELYLKEISRNTTSVVTSIDRAIESGYRIIIFKNIEDVVTMNKSIYTKPSIEETEGYIVLGDKSKCRTISPINSTYLQRLGSLVMEAYGRRLSCSFLGCELR